MVLAFVAFAGGVLTILSPCVLPVLPFVFARSDRPFVRGTLPLLLGMTLSFAAVASLAAVGGGWAVRANQYGRVIAMVVFALLGLALLSTRVADWLARPAVALGNHLRPESAGAAESVLLGVATGLLWAPCAGPILGLILAGAAAGGPSVGTTALLLCYALGAGASLGLAVLGGQKVFAALSRTLNAGLWLRRGLGVAVLVAVFAVALGWDTGALARLSSTNTARVEQTLIDAAGVPEVGGPVESDPMENPPIPLRPSTVPSVEGQMPSLDGAASWINSAPLNPQDLRGKVVLIDFWTYSCINCLRSLPYVKSWYQRYKDQGLVVIGVHTPEFAFEKQSENVSRAVRDLGIGYPVVLDNNYAIWQAFGNHYWPAHYFVDAGGQLRGHHFGEGDYAESEQLIRTLLSENGARLTGDTGSAAGTGVQAPADQLHLQSPETYLGYARVENFASSQTMEPDAAQAYSIPPELMLNQWALQGNWRVGAEAAQSEQAGAAIAFRFRARDLHLVLGPAPDGAPVRFRVSIDGAPPGDVHGMDVAADGFGTVTEQRLYQLIRQHGSVDSHTFSIEFLDAGAQAYAFTFG